MSDEPEENIPIHAIAVWDLSNSNISLALTVEGNVILLAEKGVRGVVLGGAEIPPQEFVTKVNFVVHGILPTTSIH